MSSVLRSVRKRKKGRTLGAVDIIDRAEYAELEVDAKVELIRSLVPLGLMHIEELLDEEVTALAGERYARKDPRSRRAPAWQQPRDGRVGRPARADSGPPDSPCHGARDSPTVVRGVAWRSRSQRPAADAGAIWDFVPQLRGRGGGDSRGDRVVGVDRVPRRSSRPVPTKLHEFHERDLSNENVVAIVLGRQDVRRGDDGRLRSASR